MSIEVVDMWEEWIAAREIFITKRCQETYSKMCDISHRASEHPYYQERFMFVRESEFISHASQHYYKKYCNMDIQDWLKKQHTRVLMQHLKVCQMYHGQSDICGRHGNRQWFVSLSQLKEELATREHIPNKREAKAIRQAKAKANRNKGK